MMNYTTIVTILLLLLSGQNVNGQESPPEANASDPDCH